MPPDLNSLPPSNPPSPHNSHITSHPVPATSQSPLPNPLQQHSPTLTSRARGSPHRPSPRVGIERRSSSRLGSFSLHNDASAGSSPVTADPHHHRVPSLGELHQELENEQEAQVVCQSIPSLQQIRSLPSSNRPSTESPAGPHSTAAGSNRSYAASFSSVRSPRFTTSRTYISGFVRGTGGFSDPFVFAASFCSSFSTLLHLPQPSVVPAG